MSYLRSESREGLTTETYNVTVPYGTILGPLTDDLRRNGWASETPVDLPNGTRLAVLDKGKIVCILYDHPDSARRKPGENEVILELTE